MTAAATPTLRPQRGPQRLKRSVDFDVVTRRGRRVRGPLLHLVHRPNDLDAARVGFSVSRRAGNAVTRNRIKRRLRELVTSHELTPGRDIVLVAQPAAAGAAFEDLRAELASHLASARLLSSPPPPAAESSSTDPPPDDPSSHDPARRAPASPAFVSRPMAEGSSSAERVAVAAPAMGEHAPRGLAARLALGAIRGYQRVISPSQPAACRYEPTCSAYAATAVARYGAARGSWLAAKRLLRCRPGAEGGYDPVPERAPGGPQSCGGGV